MNDLGNIILIDHDFEYNKEVHALEHGIEMSEVRSQKIGYNNAEVRKKLTFEEGCKYLPIDFLGISCYTERRIGH